MTAILQYTVCDDNGALCTPLFEFCSPDNRVIVRHDRASLTLLAVRRIHDGRYWPYSKTADAFDKSRIDTGVRSARLHLVDSMAVNTRTRGERDRFVAAARRLGAEHEGLRRRLPLRSSHQAQGRAVRHAGTAGATPTHGRPTCSRPY